MLLAFNALAVLLAPRSSPNCAAASAVRMARLDTLTPERGARIGVTSPVVGTINLYQVGNWAVSHVERHDPQMESALGRAR